MSQIEWLGGCGKLGGQWPAESCTTPISLPNLQNSPLTIPKSSTIACALQRALGVHCALWWVCMRCAWALACLLHLPQAQGAIDQCSLSSIQHIKKPTWLQRCHGLCYRLAHCLCSLCISHQRSQPFRLLPLPGPAVWLSLDQWQPLHWGVSQHAVQSSTKTASDQAN